jgi:hypothetical protein
LPLSVSKNAADWNDITSRMPAKRDAFFILSEFTLPVLTITRHYSP